MRSSDYYNPNSITSKIQEIHTRQTQTQRIPQSTICNVNIKD